MASNAELKRALGASFDEFKLQLDAETIDEMAFRSYLQGNFLSRAIFWRKLDHVIRLAHLTPTSRALDFGCGSGIILPRLCAGGGQVFATDLVLEPAQKLARQLHLDQVRFFDASAWATAIEDESLDVIIAANVLEHVDDRIGLLQQFARKLRRQGVVVVSGPTENFLYQLGRKIIGFSGHYHVSNINHVIADFTKSGFRMKEVVASPVPGPFCLYKIASLQKAEDR